MGNNKNKKDNKVDILWVFSGDSDFVETLETYNDETIMVISSNHFNENIDSHIYMTRNGFYENNKINYCHYDIAFPDLIIDKLKYFGPGIIERPILPKFALNLLNNDQNQNINIYHNVTREYYNKE